MRKIHLVGLVLLAAIVIFVPARSSAQISVGVAVHIGPPALPVYEQPICPGANYLWTPGYWAYGPDGYFWVPGTWVVAPTVGFLWTPGYWGWGGGGYLWHAGYWGPHVGFYGGINYGFGYGGVGFVGGRWEHGAFAYNTAIMHVNTTVVHTTYIDRTVVRTETVNRVSFNGGTGGINAHASGTELSAEREHHLAPTSLQTQHEHSASTNRAFLASENHGRPAVAATARPGEFSGHGVVAAREASHSNTVGGGNRPASNGADLHKSDRPPSHKPSNVTASSTSHTNNTPASHPNTVSGTPHTSTGGTSHVNNGGGSNQPKNQPHPQTKPQSEGKPQGESKPHGEGKPHS